MKRHLTLHEKPDYLRQLPRVLLDHVVELDSAEALRNWTPRRARQIFIGRRGWEASGLRPLDGMRVLFVRPPRFGPVDTNMTPPLAPALLAGIVRRQGGVARVWDSCVEVDLQGRVGASAAAALRSEAPDTDAAVAAALDAVLASCPAGPFDVVGVSVEMEAPLRPTLRLARALQKRFGARMIFGNRGTESAPDDFGALGAVVAGDGEYALACWLSALAGGVARPAGIPGLMPAELPSYASVDLDLRATPDFTGIDLAQYRVRRLPYQMSLGCPHHCAFCNTYTSGGFRLRSPAAVAADLRALVEQHGVREFMFLDNLVNVHLRWMRETLHLMKEHAPGIAWSDCARPGQLNRDDLRLLASAGAHCMYWGVDAPSARLNAAMGKHHDPDEVDRILREAEDEGLCNHVNLLLGLPGETQEDFEEALRFVERNAAVISELIATPYEHAPGSLIDRWPGDYTPPGKRAPLVPERDLAERRVRQLRDLAAARLIPCEGLASGKRPGR